jgi:hypothetical protein
VQNNDVSINLVIGVSFLRKECPKSWVIPSTATFHSMAVVQRINVPFEKSFHFFILGSIIPFVAPRWKNECLGLVERESKQEGSIINKRKRERKENYIELERKFVKQLGRFTLNRLHQGHLMYFEK